MLKMSIFTTYFQKLIKHEFPLHILYELLMTLRRFRPCLHGVGDLDLVGEVSFVLCPPELENKRNQPH